MKRTTFGKAAMSSLLVATTMVGCTGAAFRTHTAAVKQDHGKSAAAAEKALASHNMLQAVEAAEAAVRGAPDNAAYRQLLGRAYAQSGRFASAETAFTDAMTLGNTDARTIVSLALVQVGLGKSEQARTLLSANTDKVPAGDYGLAIAMAGDAAEGARILSEAIQDPSATVRTRQNLAYAYALAGRWKDARMVAGMDMEPLAANQRISQWAAIAEPSLAPQRVAALMGVTINESDVGQPVALALAPAAAPTMLADAAPEMTTPAADQPDASMPAPVAVAAAPEQAPTPTRIIETAPVIKATAAPVRVAAKPDFVVEAPNAKAKAPKATAPAPTLVARIQQAAFIKPTSGNGASNWVVQLGAYDTAAIAKDKWMGMARANSTLSAFPILTSQATVNGKAYHRLAVSGFANRADAMSLCRSIRTQRGQCFVRESAANATPQRWAIATKGRQYASR